MRLGGFYLGLTALLLLGGCGSFRVLRESNTGGTVALEGAHEPARSKAERYMRSQCPQGYEIVEEGDHRSLLARGGLYARLWAHQSGGFLGEEAGDESPMASPSRDAEAVS